MRLSGDNQKQTPLVTTTPTPHVDKEEIVCYSCYEVGHKSPQCPKKKKGTVKRIEILVDMPTRYVRIPLTIDSCAQMMVVPLEVVKPEELAGEMTKLNGIIDGGYEGQQANVRFTVGSDFFTGRQLQCQGSKLTGWLPRASK